MLARRNPVRRLPSTGITMSMHPVRTSIMKGAQCWCLCAATHSSTLSTRATRRTHLSSRRKMQHKRLPLLITTMMKASTTYLIKSKEKLTSMQVIKDYPLCHSCKELKVINVNKRRWCLTKCHLAIRFKPKTQRRRSSDAASMTHGNAWSICIRCHPEALHKTAKSRTWCFRLMKRVPLTVRRHERCQFTLRRTRVTCVICHGSHPSQGIKRRSYNSIMISSHESLVRDNTMKMAS